MEEQLPASGKIKEKKMDSHKLEALFELDKNKDVVDNDLLSFAKDHGIDAETVILLQIVRELKKANKRADNV